MSQERPPTMLAALFDSQRFAVLATAQVGAPYANLVAFAVTPDLKGILFATPRLTRKYGNLCREPRVAMLIDSRANQATDCQAAVAATAVGHAVELAGEPREAWLGVYLRHHPELAEFVQAASTSLFHVRVERYVLVDHFQHVVEVDPAAWPAWPLA